MPQEEIAPFRATITPEAHERLRTEYAEDGSLPSGAWIRVVLGDAGTALIKSSRRRRVDVIALGNCGIDAVAEHFLESVANDVLTAAPCDVLIVPTAP